MVASELPVVPKNFLDLFERKHCFMALFLAPLRAPLKGGAHGATPGAPWFPSRAESQLALLSSWLAWGWAGSAWLWLALPRISA